MTVLEIKAAVRARDGNRCTECGTTAEEHIELVGQDLEVHRLIPGSPYTVEGCVTLCRSCHGPKPRRARGTADSISTNIRTGLTPQLRLLCLRNETDFTEEVNRAVREMLARERLWPPSSSSHDGD